MYDNFDLNKPPLSPQPACRRGGARPGRAAPAAAQPRTGQILVKQVKSVELAKTGRNGRIPVNAGQLVNTGQKGQ